MGSYNISKIFNKYDRLSIESDYVKLTNKDGFEEKEIQTKNINSVSLQKHRFLGIYAIFFNIFFIFISLVLRDIPNRIPEITNDYIYIYLMD